MKYGYSLEQAKIRGCTMKENGLHAKKMIASLQSSPRPPNVLLPPGLYSNCLCSYIPFISAKNTVAVSQESSFKANSLV